MASYREVILVEFGLLFTKELHEFPPLQPARKRLARSSHTVEKNSYIIPDAAFQFDSWWLIVGDKRTVVRASTCARMCRVAFAAPVRLSQSFRAVGGSQARVGSVEGPPLMHGWAEAS